MTEPCGIRPDESAARERAAIVKLILNAEAALAASDVIAGVLRSVREAIERGDHLIQEAI